jgi:hypothetical protein
MTDAFRSAFAFFVDDLEAALGIFIDEAESVASGPIGDIDELESLIDEILEDAEAGPRDGSIVVERAAIAALRISSSDPSDDLQDALESLNWKFRKALREFKEALVRETAGATP